MPTITPVSPHCSFPFFPHSSETPFASPPRLSFVGRRQKSSGCMAFFLVPSSRCLFLFLALAVNCSVYFLRFFFWFFSFSLYFHSRKHSSISPRRPNFPLPFSFCPLRSSSAPPFPPPLPLISPSDAAPSSGQVCHGPFPLPHPPLHSITRNRFPPHSLRRIPASFPPPCYGINSYQHLSAGITSDEWLVARSRYAV